MKIPEIKRIVELYSLDQLAQAEENLINEELPNVEIGGEDEGEQLTHVIAAIYIKSKIAEEKIDFKSALRQYTNKVRESIS